MAFQCGQWPRAFMVARTPIEPSAMKQQMQGIQGMPSQPSAPPAQSLMLRSGLARAGLVAGVAIAAAACAPVVAPVAPQPIEETADFAAVFSTQLPLNNTFYTRSKPELFRRILLTPSLVFEDLRLSPLSPAPSAVAEGASGDTPLDGRVEARLSTLLLDYFGQRGAALVVPAALARWTSSSGGACVSDCGTEARSWVERAILAPKTATPDELGKVPTVILAVRALGRSTVPLAVVAVRDEATQKVVVRPRSLGSRDALCLWTADVPVISFSAELVDPADGRLVARVDEHRILKVRSDYERVITVRERAEEAMHGMLVVGDGSPGLCRALYQSLGVLVNDASEQAGDALDLTVDELLRSTLDPLMRQ